MLLIFAGHGQIVPDDSGDPDQMATIIDVADAVVAALNSASLSVGFVATRAYIPVYELSDLSDLKVTVVPRSMTISALTRTSDDFDYVVDVAIQRRIGPGSASSSDIQNTADPLMDLAEEIVDLFRGRRLATFAVAMCVAVANAPIYVPEHLDEKRVFTSVLSLTFRVTRNR